jgi:hypothetical protein
LDDAKQTKQTVKQSVIPELNSSLEETKYKQQLISDHDLSYTIVEDSFLEQSVNY